jgi:hypothetical protein
MRGVRCTSCEFTIEDRPENKKVITTIQDWIHYMVLVETRQEHTARHINRKEIPCPQCGAHKTWANLA